MRTRRKKMFASRFCIKSVNKRKWDKRWAVRNDGFYFGIISPYAEEVLGL